MAESKATVTYGDKNYEIVKEGSAQILKLIDDAPNSDTPAKAQVFYNPIQQFNRDLSVLAIRVFSENYSTIRRLRNTQPKGKKRKREPADDRPEAEKIDTPAMECEPAQVDAQENSINPIPTGPKSDSTTAERTSKPTDTFRILDALSATGLRALRYAKETIATSVTANDLSRAATESIKLNVQHNEVMEVVKPLTGDARVHMYNVASTPELYQVIDLDPYGTAAPFFDAAVQAVTDGGLLCITCTDAAVFASVGYLEKTFSQYGGLPFKGSQSHEGGLRLILHAVATSAARYGKAIEPLLSLSIDFYARIFIRVRRAPAEVKLLAGKTMLVYNCDGGCGAWTTQFLARNQERKAKNGDPIWKFSLAQGPTASPNCEHCGFKTHLSGPMWGGPLHNPFYVQKILDLLPSLDKEIYATIPRIEGMLTLARDEALLDDSPTLDTPQDVQPETAQPQEAQLEGVQPTPSASPFPSLPPSTRTNHPFFLLPSHLASILHCVSPSDAAFRGALLHLGYRTSRSHTKPGSIVTDAPWDVIWEIMREFVRQKSPIKEGAIKAGTAGAGIMSKSRTTLPPTIRTALHTLATTPPSSLSGLKTSLQALLYRLEHPDTDTNTLENSDVSTLEISFDESLGKQDKGGRKLVRYQTNPREGWGPMRKAGG